MPSNFSKYRIVYEDGIATMTINEFAMSDYGVFTCEASNSLGKTSSSCRLYYEGMIIGSVCAACARSQRYVCADLDETPNETRVSTTIVCTKELVNITVDVSVYDRAQQTDVIEYGVQPQPIPEVMVTSASSSEGEYESRKPTFVLGLSDQTVHRGGAVRLKAIVSGALAPLIEWQLSETGIETE